MSSKIIAFQQRQGKWITPNCQHIQVGLVHYYGIHKNQQMHIQHSSESIFLTHQCYVLQNMKLAAGSKVIQVIGDSASFSKEGQSRLKTF